MTRGFFSKCYEKSLKAVSRSEAQDLYSTATLEALWELWENSKMRGTGIRFGYWFAAITQEMIRTWARMSLRRVQCVFGGEK